MKRLLLIYYFLSVFIVVLDAQSGAPSDTVILNYVSIINEAGDVKLNWTYYIGEDTIDGFIMNYKRHLGTGVESNEPFGIASPDSTNYIDTSGEAKQTSVPYSVYSFIYNDDSTSIDTIRRVSLSSTHHTIFLESEWEECFSSLDLNWNRYIGWGDDSIYYRIYENGVYIDKTPDTFYFAKSVNINLEYQYVVEAINFENKFTSRSNIVIDRTSFPESTEFINVDYVQVEGESIGLRFTLGDKGIGYDYTLWAKPPGSNTFSDSLTTFAHSNNLKYDFLTANVLQQYQFILQEIDRCGNPIKESNICSNIVLQGEKKENVVHLNWTEYIDWLGGGENYKIFRNTGDGDVEIYETDGTTYKDNITTLIDNKQITSISYYIEATEVGSDFYSRSNIITIYLEPELEYPTAFTPNDDGMNDIFRPINLYFVPTDYQLIVFDRWGKKMFETSQVDEGWDGKFSSGKNVLEGVYHYHVKYKNAEGIETSQTGIVTVIYP